jgi:formate C-acetyltransferase
MYMKLFEQLNIELQKNEGIYAPYYFRYLGYIENMSADYSNMRANGIYALFTQPQPIILQSEWIAGNQKSLFCEENELVLNYARNITESFSQRNFITNKDHYAPDYEHILHVGLPGMIAETDTSLKAHCDDPEKTLTLQAMKKTLCGFSEMIKKYMLKAEALEASPEFDKKRLKFIADNCSAILSAPPKSFGQALQLVWFCHTAFLMEGRYAMALGRMDQYLYPFYKADIDQGILNDEMVIELLENIFIKLKGDVVNICIGGQNKQGECNVNPLSYCILRAVKNCNVPGPNLSLRYTQNTPDDFLDECLKTIGTGLGYPAIMNDDVNIAALKKYGYADDDVYNYSMVGCIENFISGKQPPWSDGRFDTPRFFDYIFNDGISVTNRSAGLNLCKLDEISSMSDFMDVFEKQLAFGVDEYVFRFNSQNDSINQAFFAEPFLSCFCRDCIGRGLDINCGGSIYPSVHGAALMGIGTVCDSLAAIEKLVFEEHAITLSELRDAMNANFEGYRELRQKLLDAPKYGNNDPFVDKYAVWFIDYLGSLFEKKKTRDGGGIYIAAAANVSNIYAGRIINATPDGRLRGEPLSDAASPTYGRDTRGATSTLSSVSKPDYTKVACGSVVNQKFSPAMFTDENRKKLMALIKTYFKKGGQELQINATSRETLLDAIDHPEKYQNLVVRVSGFSAFYVTLDKGVQLDILNRTQQE